MYEVLIAHLRECAKLDASNNTYTEAADAIEKMSKDLERSKEWEAFWEKETNEALNKFQTTVANMPRWIPVTERLPESVCKSYLCLTDTGYHCEVRWTNNIFGLGESDRWEWSIADVPQYCKVTHWMPLPNPPKEE